MPNWAQDERASRLGAQTQQNTVKRNMSQATPEAQINAPNASDAVNALKQDTAQQASQVASRQMAKTSKKNAAFFGE